MWCIFTLQFVYYYIVLKLSLWNSLSEAGHEGAFTAVIDGELRELRESDY